MPPWALVVLAGASAAALRLAVGPPAAGFLAIGTGWLAAALLVHVGARRYRPQVWAFVALALAIVCGTSSMGLRDLPDGPVVAALLAATDIGSNVFGAVGVLLFARTFGRPDLDAWLDAGSIGLLVSIVIYDISARSAVVTGTKAIADFGVAALDAILFAILLRFILRFQRNPGLLLLALVLAGAIAMDAAYSAGGGALTGLPQPLYESVWLLAYTIIGSAALHPGLRMARSTRHVPADLTHMARRVFLAVAIHTGSGLILLLLIGGQLVLGIASQLPVLVLGVGGLLVLGTLRSLRVVRRIEADLDARLAAEALLRASEQRYHRLAEVAPVGIIEAGPDRQTISSNAAWLAMIGRAEGDDGPAAGGLVEAVHPEDRPRVAAAWDVAAAGGAPIDVDHRLVRRDGTTRWARTTAVPLLGDGGVVTGWVIAVADVTDLVEARTAALEREAVATGLQDQSPVGIEVYDVNGRTIRRNDAQRQIRRLVGLPDEPVVDVRADALTSALAQGPAVERALAGSADAAEPESVGIAVTHRDGRTGDAWMRIRWFALKGDDGRVTAVISFTEDVTARVHAAADREAADLAVREAAKLEALGVLAGGIAHDFNNILVAILGHIGFAREVVAEGSSAAADLAAAEQAAHRAADLARQMLAYSGHGTISVGPMSLNTAAREMGDMANSSLAAGAKVVYELDGDLPPVIADATQMRQIVLNLVVNASEALAGQPGTITVRTGLTTVHAGDPDLAPGTAVEPGVYAVLEVADTGVGMDQETLHRIFEPFFSTKKTGRGLGLAATLGIVKGHDGAIRVRSTRGVGTSFEILLRPDGGVLPLPAPAPVRSERQRYVTSVLVVDDEDAVRLVSRRVLERAGYSVAEAGGGPEAITRFAAAPGAYAAVVLDLAMPGMDGREVLHELRRRRATIPVVICSGWAADDVGDMLRATPHTVFVQKPFTPAELTSAVEAAIAAARTADSATPAD